MRFRHRTLPRRRTLALFVLRSLVVCAGCACAAATPSADWGDPSKTVLARYVEAVGGKTNLERVRSRATQSTMAVKAMGFPLKGDIETLQQAPDLIVTRIKFTLIGEAAAGYDGKTGWRQESDEAPIKVEGEELRRLRMDSLLHRELRLAELYPTRKPMPDAAIDGKKQHVLQMTPSFGGVAETWWFDAATGLLTRTAIVKDGGPDTGQIRSVTTFSDYRTVDGVKLAFRATGVESKVGGDGGDETTTVINSITHNTPIDAAKFAPTRE